MREVILDPESVFHCVWLHKWYARKLDYPFNHREVKNLCPYAWGTLALLLMFPLALLVNAVVQSGRAFGRDLRAAADKIEDVTSNHPSATDAVVFVFVGASLLMIGVLIYIIYEIGLWLWVSGTWHILLSILIGGAIGIIAIAVAGVLLSLGHGSAWWGRRSASLAVHLKRLGAWVDAWQNQRKLRKILARDAKELLNPPKPVARVPKVKVKRESLFWAMVKAWYHQHCPNVKWADETALTDGLASLDGAE